MVDCDVKVMGCTDDATHSVKLDGTHNSVLLDEIERVTCEAHIPWYRKEYVKGRGYKMEVEPL